MKNLKPWFFTSGLFTGLSLVCFIVKIIEATMRTAHDWAQVFVILGFVFLGIALLILVVIALLESCKEKKNVVKEEVSDQELLEKYKSKSKK